MMRITSEARITEVALGGDVLRCRLSETIQELALLNASQRGVWVTEFSPHRFDRSFARNAMDERSCCD